MVREIDVPAVTGSQKQTFLKFTLRKPIDFAVVSVATLITLEGGICADARIVLGAVAPGPLTARDAEEVLRGRAIDEHTAGRAAEEALSGAKPLGRNAYKVQIAKTLIKNALMSRQD
jgi:xanthine dehydrogenase YagS FAD-binding subunit